MKKVLLSLFVIAALASCEKDCDECETKDCEINPDSTLVCKTNLTAGLLAYYPFNGNFNDESGNGNNATSKNGAFLTTDYIGRTNSSAGFDGVDDYLIVPGSSKLNADSITVSLQIMVNSTNRYYAAISRVNFETAQSVAFNVHKSLVTDNFWTFSLPTGTDNCSKTYSSRDESFYAYSKGPILPGRWYNIIVSFAGGNQKLYVNGVLDVTKSRTFNNAKKCDNADLVIGGWWKSDIASPDGKIDEVRLYNRVLSDCEIAKLAEAFK